MERRQTGLLHFIRDMPIHLGSYLPKNLKSGWYTIRLLYVQKNGQDSGVVKHKTNGDDSEHQNRSILFLLNVLTVITAANRVPPCTVCRVPQHFLRRNAFRLFVRLPFFFFPLHKSQFHSRFKCQRDSRATEENNSETSIRADREEQRPLI